MIKDLHTRSLDEESGQHFQHRIIWSAQSLSSGTLQLYEVSGKGRTWQRGWLRVTGEAGEKLVECTAGNAPGAFPTKTMARWVGRTAHCQRTGTIAEGGRQRSPSTSSKAHTSLLKSLKKKNQPINQSPKSMGFIMVSRVFRFLKIHVLFIRRKKQKVSGNIWSHCI